jgi:hypothetical protein
MNALNMFSVQNKVLDASQTVCDAGSCQRGPFPSLNCWEILNLSGPSLFTQIRQCATVLTWVCLNNLISI